MLRQYLRHDENLSHKNHSHHTKEYKKNQNYIKLVKKCANHTIRPFQTLSQKYFISIHDVSFVS
jgi:hypothetical protein